MIKSIRELNKFWIAFWIVWLLMPITWFIGPWFVFGGLISIYVLGRLAVECDEAELYSRAIHAMLLVRR